MVFVVKDLDSKIDVLWVTAHALLRPLRPVRCLSQHALHVHHVHNQSVYATDTPALYVYRAKMAADAPDTHANIFTTVQHEVETDPKLRERKKDPPSASA